MTPWPLSETTFLVSYGATATATATTRRSTRPATRLYLIDVLRHQGTDLPRPGDLLLHADPAAAAAAAADPARRDRPERAVRRLLGAERRPRACRAIDAVAGPVPPHRRRASPGPTATRYGGQRYEPDVKSVMINWNPVRVLGDVPVEADGSAQFRVPVDTAVYFQLLDENHMELRRMRSFISFQPGEVRGCVGCHETRERGRRRRRRSRWPWPASRRSPCRRPGATGRSASCATCSRCSTSTASAATAG